MPKKKNPETFETQLEQLEDIVDAMEDGDLSLDEALTHFEQGVKLTKQCQQLLDQARQKVKILTDSDTLSDFTTTDPDS